MGSGNSKNQKIDWINSFDPRITGLASPKGTLFRFVPATGLAELLLKQDNGFSTDWRAMASAAPEGVYYVTPDGEYPTIQSAIDQAYADGSGVDGKFGVIFIGPGEYTENLIFRPGQALIGDATLVSIGAIQINGQHVYTPPAGGEILEKTVNLQGVSLFNTQAGPTITINGVNEGFFNCNGVTFAKGGTGPCVYCPLVSCILVMAQCNIVANDSPDPCFISHAMVTVLQQNSHQSGGTSPLLEYLGNGSVNFSSNNMLGNSPYIASFAAGTIFATFNFVGTFAADADGFRVGTGATMYFVNGTIIVTPGTGYAFQGEGIVNGAMIVYGGGNGTKDPALTFNLLPSDPS